MNTAAQILRECDRAMLREIGSGHAAPEVRECFRRQLMAGQSAPLLAADLSRQSDFTEAQPIERNGQQLLF